MIAVYIAFLLFVGVSVALLYIAKDKEEYGERIKTLLNKKYGGGK